MTRMIFPSSRRRIAAACGAGFVCAGFSIAFLSFSIRETALAAPLPAAPVEQDMANTAQIGDWQGVILTRPLFSRTRRPDAAPDVSTSRPRLAGIVASLGRRRAIFMTQGAGRGQVVDVGATVGPWRIVAIGVDSVRVTGEDGEQTLRPDRDRSADGKTDGAPAPGDEPGISSPDDQKPEDQTPGGTR
ncbi:general secretion pathway protein GspN [Gluconacetobacter tumulisoli]|uniref:General secretion pathway protein GspN n=1 Tax=Gluconacetobacter tumulisoli TaxID=1286189 RepID=A0A7W4K950_9PROT|nr:general secretion pathway protein GspN [Gluconacetobacter tumulisoli]MBB2202575.1 general secretion pathway protein GspN [Gluconacetobacter tumulisoli]